MNSGFWRGENKADKEGEADILRIRRCSLTKSAAAAVRHEPEVVFPSLLIRQFRFEA